MRLSLKAFLVVALILLTAVHVYPGDKPLYDPPPPPPDDFPDFPDLPDLPLPPDPFDIPFDPNDLPDPWELPPPPEDPWDDPTGDFPLPPPPPDIDDPFPDFPSLFPGDNLGYSVITPDSSGSRALDRAAATNVVTKLMPYPMRLPFIPSASGARTVAKPRVCNPSNATQLAIPESKRNTVAFLNTCPWQIVAHVPVGITPVGVAGTPDGTQALVANAGNGASSGTVSVISLANRSVTKTITFPAAAPDGSPVVPNVIAVLPDGSRAYVTSHSCNPRSFAYMIDMATLNVIGSPLSVGCYPSSIAVTPDGSQVWVSSRGDSRVDIFDTATNMPVFAFNVQLPTGIAFNPTGTTAYIGEGTSPGNVVVIDTSSYQVITRIPVGNLPHAVAVTPTGRHVFVTNGLSNSISQISTITNKVIRTIKLPNGWQHPLGITFIQ
jgi:YVTN family beta-propeller protein